MIRFQAMAPTSAAIIRKIESSMNLGSKEEMSMIFFPIVSATAVPKRNGPTNSPNAAIPKAIRGVIAPVAIMVATTLAASWKPLVKPKKRAKAMTNMAKNKTEPSMGNLLGELTTCIDRFIMEKLDYVKWGLPKNRIARRPSPLPTAGRGEEAVS